MTKKPSRNDGDRRKTSRRKADVKAETRENSTNDERKPSSGVETRPDETESSEDQNDRFQSPSDEMFHLAHNFQIIAIACVKELFPDKWKLLDLKRLTIEPNEFYSEKLKKRIADIVYTIPLLNSSEVVKLTLILEHKGQSSTSENRETAAQVLTYVAEFCRRESQKPAAKASNPGAQPIPVVIYTGPDETLEKLEWSNLFKTPTGFDEFAMTIPIKFVNMTKLRREGKLPKNPFLEAMYDIMTRHDASEYQGFAQTALKALARIKRRMTSQEQSLTRSLMVFFMDHARSLNVRVEKDDMRKLVASAKMGESMSKESEKILHDFFADDAEKAGIEQGIAQGIEQGIGQGIGIGKQEMKDDILSEQRAAVRSDVETRFGVVPVTLTQAMDKAQDVNALVDMRVYALTKASSLDDLISYAQNAVF